MPDRSWALQRKLMRAPDIGFNAEVRRWFADLDLTPNVNRTALRDSLLIQANESRTSATFKVNYFREFVQKVHNKPAIVGLEKQEWDELRLVEYKPKVILYFRQDWEAVPNDYNSPINARISFRLTNETSQSLTQSNLQTLATQIKNELALPQGYTFDKGKYLCKYKDRENGYDFQINALSDTEGEQVARKIVGIRNHTFDENKFSVITPRRNTLNNSTNTTILGKTYRQPRWRPTARVRFLYADMLVYNLPEPICLVDRSGFKHKPIERVYS